MIENYPKHIYEPIRYEVAENYLIHELRKLFETVGKNYSNQLEADIRKLKESKELANPRDFWNGFHGICMGFKLKVGLIYALTAENIVWTRENLDIGDFRFGVELPQTLEISKGKLTAKEVRDFYNQPENEHLKKKYLKITNEMFFDSPRGSDPIYVFQMPIGNNRGELLTNDGNGRLGWLLLNENTTNIDSYVGRFKGKIGMLKNAWVPTSIMIDILFFARQAYESGNKTLFEKYLVVLSDIVSGSEAGKFELLNRSITSQEPFRSDVLSGLREIGVS